MRGKIENFDEAISGYSTRLPHSLWSLAMTIWQYRINEITNEYIKVKKYFRPN
ncbi:hypothetical protein [Rickettsia felis]|uniref:hypothetical protein n=1 Tax=Rickettsia felis TaxID=42862 RepID=UPI0015845585|nr:hypothetical protein [Rickettsia felis]